ncbi:hypothetical protein TARUN_8612 [Trichoderma arundinaceum]|uniref:Pal1 cell morphology n=1 Tax=Trichoderma arundinaceum TaxID=490622 RepID=A0A395NC94_TRIAR|nr:hypothetical protein TARUN_8612 [Trichoderma arundinaceum]
MDDKIDKEWARKYILDPLTAPEPSQETGLGSSHYNHYRASLQAQSSSQSHLREESISRSNFRNSLMKRASDHKRSETGDKADIYPTPPHSASPSGNLHPSNPFSSSQESPEEVEDKALATPPHSPEADHAAKSRQRHSLNHVPSAHRGGPSSGPGHNRHRSLNERFPGDMSHRPLDAIRNDVRAAERPLRHRKRISDTDMIDALDTIGGTYHHGGPYDATLLSRNLNQKYSPVAAVHDSNMEALRATPREYIIDSLQRHIPLQGTATIPSGTLDYSGSRMSYEEGPDLMREPDAPGGAFKRWDNIKYHPDDLKGKGEPSYTLEKDLKLKKRSKRGEPEEIEMQSGFHSRSSHSKPSKHQRSISVAFNNNGSSSSGNAYNSADLQRRNSTGKKLSEGLKRRWGSIRGKTRALVGDAQ